MAVNLTLSIGSDSYKGTGKTILDALKTIKPTKYLGFGKVVITEGEKVSAVPVKLVPLKLRRIFENPTDMALFAKRLETLK